MKKLIATSLALIMMLSSVSYATFAEERIIPVDSLIKNYDEDETVFYSEKQTLDFKEKLEANDYINVSVAEPKMRRCWNPFKTKEFLRKTVKVNPEINRFSIRGPEYKAPWWNIKDKIKYWWNPQNIYIDYALVLTSKDDEKILDAEEAKEGQLKPEIVKFRKFKEAVEKENGKDKISEFKETYLERVLDKLKSEGVDADAFNMVERGFIDRLRVEEDDFIEDWYYTKKEADEYNKKLREDKKKVVEKLAQKSDQDLITSGKIAELSKSNKEQTFRLVINNHLNNKKSADVMSMLLSNKDDFGDFPDEDLILEFDLKKVHPLPKRLQEANNTFEQRKLDKINKEIDKCKVKLTLKESVKKRLKDNDFIDLCCDIVNGIDSGVKKIAKHISDAKKVDDQELPNDQSYESNESPEKAAEQEKQVNENNAAAVKDQDDEIIIPLIKKKVDKIFAKKVDDKKLPNDQSSESNESPEKAAEQEKQAGKNNDAAVQNQDKDAAAQNPEEGESKQ